MSFAERFEAGRNDLHKSQRERAWALVTGILATVVALLLFAYVLSEVGVPSGTDAFIALAWALGAIFGAASLVYVGGVSSPSNLGCELSRLGLWIGNLTVSATVIVMPIAVFLGFLFVVGGFFIIRKGGMVLTMLYVTFPIIALSGSALISRLSGQMWS